MTMANNPGSSVSQLVQLFQGAFRDLNRRVSPEHIEQWSFLVHEVMSGRSREFHNLSHVFYVAFGLPPLGKLAAIYHDTIYFQIDQGLVPEIREKVSEVVVMREGKAFLSKRLEPLDEDVAFLFGFRPGDELWISHGLNEFLSAILAVKELAPALNNVELLTVAACIEATIPFRGKNGEGLEPTEIQATLIREVSRRRGMGLTENDVTSIVQLSVQVSNSDLQNFAYPEAAFFLENTWKLLPETNPDLHAIGAYTVKSFRVALQKMEKFLSSFDPTAIFHHYRGVPNQVDHQRLSSRARKNLKYAVDYLQAKFLAIALLEALAEVTGGYVPITYFTGSADSNERQLHDYLPPLSMLSYIDQSDQDCTVLNLLKFGRGGETKFDTTSSPFAAYIYEFLGTATVAKRVEDAKLACNGEQDWEWFLAQLPPELVARSASAVAEIAIGRREKLIALARRFSAAGPLIKLVVGSGRKRAA